MSNQFKSKENVKVSSFDMDEFTRTKMLSLGKSINQSSMEFFKEVEIWHALIASSTMYQER